MGISGSSALARTHPAAGGHIVNLAKREGCNRKRMTSLFIWLVPNYFSYFSSFHWGFLRFIIFSLPFFFFFFSFFFLIFLSVRICVTRCHVSHAAIVTSHQNIAHHVLLAFFFKIYKAPMNGHYFNPHYQLMSNDRGCVKLGFRIIMKVLPLSLSLCAFLSFFLSCSPSLFLACCLSFAFLRFFIITIFFLAFSLLNK